ADDLTAVQSRMVGAVVIVRNSAFSYKSKPVDPKQIGRELGARYVLQGSIRRAGSQIRINAVLIDAETDTQLWAERFDRDIGDLFAVQNEITGRIARALQSQLAIAEAHRSIQRPDAVDYVCRGRAPAYAHIGWCKFLTGSVNSVVPYFEQAIRLSPHEPAIAPWYGRLGVVHLLQSHLDEAIAALEKARSENARLAFVHAWLAAAYALKGEAQRARWALAEARRLNEGYASLTSVKKSPWFTKPEIRALAEATYFPGLRLAGIPEE